MAEATSDLYKSKISKKSKDLNHLKQMATHPAIKEVLKTNLKHKRASFDRRMNQKKKSLKMEKMVRN